jgi:hypothetical protein
MHFPAVTGFFVTLLAISLSAQIIDSTIVPEDTMQAVIDSAKVPTAADSAKASADSVSYDFMGLNEHIGPNAVAFFGSLITQTYGVNTAQPHTYTFGFGLSGDILTGLPFVHLVPQLQYWSYSENSGQGFFNRQTFRDVGLAFNAAFVSHRMTKRNFRFFAGGGPSLHLSILSLYHDRLPLGADSLPDDNYTKTTPSFKNGIGAVGGIELPLNGMFTFLVTVGYRQTYDWSTLYRRFFIFSVGLAV